MAATDRIQVFMTQTGDRFWTNVFYVNALTVLTAAAAANTVIAPHLATQMDGSFKVVKTLTSHIADNTFITTPLNVVGSLSGSDYLPLYNTARILVSVTGAGRNDYKYLRGGVTEARTLLGQLTAAAITAYETMMNDLIADMAASGVDLVDKDGNLWEVASCQAAIQMRQLHRRRKRVVVGP